MPFRKLMYQHNDSCYKVEHPGNRSKRYCSAAVAKAFYIANTGRPGPVLIDITKNAQNEMIEPVESRKV